MDDFKLKAGEKIEALHTAAKTAAGNGSSRVQNVYNQSSEAIRNVRHALHEIWNHEFIVESRERVVVWTNEAIKRIKEGAPPLSPVLLYEELVALFKDRVWRRSMLIFCAGCVCGLSAGVVVGLRWSQRSPSGPHCRALHSTSDGSVLLVDDATVPGAGAGEVLVRVQAFSVCWLDRGVLRGRGAALRALLTATNVTVGRGFAGVVLDCGEGVTSLELGDEVWGCLGDWGPGAASELLVVASGRVSRRPRALAADAAASLPWAGGGALRAVAVLGAGEEHARGKRVCIVGAASGEGCALSQLMSSWGAHVTVAAPKHHHMALQDLGASDFIDLEGSNATLGVCSWSTLEQYGANSGPWDCVVACAGAGVPSGCPPASALLRSRASRSAALDLRPRALWSDRIPAPLSLLFAASFYAYRALRCICGLGTHTQWLDEPQRLTAGLEELARLVDTGSLTPVLDKVYLPQDFEAALAHACSEDALGTTVIRFP